MTGFEKILKTEQLQKSILKSTALSSQISRSLKAHERITKSLSGVNMMSEIAKSLEQHHRVFTYRNLSAIEAISKSFKINSNLSVIPKSTIDAITSINRHQEQLFSNLRNISDVFTKNQTFFSQVHSLQLALTSISGQLASISANQRHWDLINDFEEITEEATSLNERVFEENGVTKEGLHELKEFFQRIEIKVDKIDNDASAILWRLLALISFFFGLSSEVRNWAPKPEYATKQEVKTIINNQFKIFEDKLKEKAEIRTTNRECKVYLKPKMKSIVIENLPCDFDMVVLQINHKWVYVSYSNPRDNLQETGWVKKKYLRRSEK